MYFIEISKFTPVDFLGITAGFLSLFSMIPQIIKSATSRSTRDISLLTLSLSTTSSSLWFIYGLIQADKALIICNLIGIILGLTLITLKVRFG